MDVRQPRPPHAARLAILPAGVVFMSFAVDDCQDLLCLLGQHPEWQAELRRRVLSDELLELPALMRQRIFRGIRRPSC